ALERDHDRNVQSPLDLGDAPGSEDIAEDDDLGFAVAREPFGQPLHSLPLKACAAAENREGEVGDLLRIDLHAFARGPVDEPRLIEPTVEPFRQPAKQRPLLLQIHVDAAIENPWATDILLVGANGSVKRNELHVVAERDEGSRQRVVVQTTPPNQSTPPPG